MISTLSSGFVAAMKGGPPPGRRDCLGTLLVVDDETAITASIADQLRKRYRILTANCAQEVFSLLEANDIAVILADQRMPGATGAEILAQVAADCPDTTRILITGYADIDAVIQAVNQGKIYHYLTKPWQPTELEAVVDRAFERNRLLRERRELIEELRRANTELEAKVAARTQEIADKNAVLEALNQTKNQFLGMAAHDLRSPLNSIQALAELILDEDVSMTREERLDFLTLICDQARGMSHLIGNLLDIAKIESGKVELLLEPVAIVPYLEATWKRHHLLANEKKFS